MTRLAIETDYYRAGEGPDTSREVMPENVRNVILSRVDRLDGRLKGVLAAAAVIGRLFQRQVLQSLIDTEIDLHDTLSELEDRSLIYEERAIPEVEYGFNHVLTREAVYLSILPRRRRQLHERVAEVMESLYEHRLDEYCEHLAFHYARSGNRSKALRYLVKAGAKARRAYSNAEAIGYLRRALDLTDESSTDVDEQMH